MGVSPYVVGDDASEVVSEPAVARLEGRAIEDIEDGIVALCVIIYVSRLLDYAHI